MTGSAVPQPTSITAPASAPTSAPVSSPVNSPASAPASAPVASFPRRALGAVRRHIALELLTLAGVVIALFFGPRLVLGPRVKVEVVTRANFVQTVVATGRVETPHRVDVGVQLTGTVARVPVAEGQTVVAGAPLIELESTELRALLNQAQHAVQVASAHLRQVAEVQSPVAAQVLRQAQLNHDSARDALARSNALLTGGAIGEAARDDAHRAEQAAAAQLESARRQVASASPAGSDAEAARAALSQAQAGVDLARARLAYATVRAPRAGILITRHVEPGDVVQPGRVLMMLSPGGETQLVVQIDEKNLQLIRVGQSALASVDAYPKDRVVAQVVYVNPGIDAQRGAVEVKLRVPSPPAYLRQDMTASVDIQIARRDSAILVPSDAVHDVESTAPWVYRITGGRARRQAVTLGLRSGGLSEVLTGLAVGDHVVPASDLTVHDGARVRATLPVVRR